jgi:oligoribonuclease (3'-5' exoribonuclease)
MPLLHLDLETTGLDEHTDHILEVAWTITDDKLRSPWPVIVDSRVITPSAETWKLIEASQFIQDMHGPTGLLKELMNTVLTSDLGNVEREIIGDLNEYEGGGPRQEWHLAGASVHFDLGFIKVWMPNLAKRLHHRVYDTSTLRQFFSSLNVEHGVVNNKPHRAAHDVQEMLTMAWRYRYFTKSLIHQVARSAGGRGLKAAVKKACSGKLRDDLLEKQIVIELGL